MKDETTQKLLFPVCASCILLFQFWLNVLPHLTNTLRILNDPGTQYEVIQHPFWRMLISVIACLLLIVSGKLCDRTIALVKITIVGSIFSMVGVFLSDLMVITTKATHGFLTFNSSIQQYFGVEWTLYFVSLITTAFYCFLIFRFRSEIKDDQKNAKQKQVIFAVFIAVAAILPLIIPLPIQIANFQVFSSQQNSVPFGVAFMINTIYAICAISLLAIAIKKRNDNTLTAQELIKISMVVAIGAALAFAVIFVLLFLSFKWLAIGARFSYRFKMLSSYMSSNLLAQLPIVAVIIVGVISRTYWKKKQFDIKEQKTSGRFGSARWATYKDLDSMGMYDSRVGPIIGQDNRGRLLYLPLQNKLTIAPPGTGKTTASSIPVLLSEDRPIFALDVKGELWATTARYREEVFKRKQVAIDPYGVTKTADFKQGKPDSLLVDYRINPFDFVPEDEKLRDRMINAFASSFIIADEGSNSRHFDENARLLIRGYIDYMMKALESKSRNLATLYHLLSEKSESAKMTFADMSELSGRAAAASNQVGRVGVNERGSILSTTYRQIDWMSDSNMQQTLSESNFDLRDFLKGNTDIFVILPAEQVHEHGRLVRMLMALLLALIVQANPSELPSKKMLFLLDELAQLGYCPDVERFIEIMRDRGIVVWSVFQSLSQIELFKKPDLFKGAATKQVFTLDDVKTMQWVQSLGGKETIINKTLSINSGDSSRRMQAFGGTVSHGDGESVQETGVDLIRTNEIREMPKNEQFVFLHGFYPIRCSKVRYWEHPFFVGKYDINPVEKGRK